VGEPLVLGREGVGPLCLGDVRMSQRHAEVAWNGRFEVRDLGSRNGTFLDGVRLGGETPLRAERGLLRLGSTLVLLVPDLRPHLRAQVSVEDGRVIGPSQRRALDQAVLARSEGLHLLVHGENGTGKERLAEAYHRAGRPPGPWVVVNCAQLQPGLADGQLFGNAKGVATGVLASRGYFLQADGGVLFLDEVAELDAVVQAKLLRALESGEVARLGESTPVHVEVRVVAASHRDLRAEVAAGRFREDLFMRLKKAEIELPALRDRPEEVPFLMQLALEGRGVGLHVTAVQRALLRRWPGNVRDLMDETVKAALVAREAGLRVILDEQLGPEPTPVPISPGPARQPLAPDEARSGRAPAAGSEYSIDELREALARNGNVKSRTARALGLQRNQLYRLLVKYRLVDGSGDPADDEPEADRGAEKEDQEQSSSPGLPPPPGAASS
jgi:DNA-binding NtrC family response regulator